VLPIAAVVRPTPRSLLALLDAVGTESARTTRMRHAEKRNIVWLIAEFAVHLVPLSTEINAKCAQLVLVAPSSLKPQLAPTVPQIHSMLEVTTHALLAPTTIKVLLALANA